jgi:hypothetical protein
VSNSVATVSNSATTVLELCILGQVKVWLGPHLTTLGPPPMGESMGIKLVELLLIGWLREGLLLFVPFVGFMAFSFF